MNFDCIIVLPNKLKHNGDLNDETSARVRLAVQIYLQKPVPLILSGSSYAQLVDQDISEKMKMLAIQEGVREEDLYLEKNSRDTVGDAYFTIKNVAIPKGFKSLLIVSSDYHLERAKVVFEKIGGPRFQMSAKGCAGFSSPNIIEAEKKSMSVFNQTFCNIKAGDLQSVYQKMRADHPYYNGSLFPQI